MTIVDESDEADETRIHLNAETIAKLAKLQVFLDAASGELASLATKENNKDVNIAAIVGPKSPSGPPEAWLLKLRLTDPMSYESIAQALRHTEAYQLVSFLLTEGASGEKLTVLSDRYGVSPSHFRRLCTQALGQSPKTIIRDWRMAQSMLEVVNGKHTLTQIAMKYGYASSSHFSNEVKQLLGHSPSHLFNANEAK